MTSHPLSRPLKLHEIRARIAASAYVVDPVLVADAFLRQHGLQLFVSARSPSG